MISRKSVEAFAGKPRCPLLWWEVVRREARCLDAEAGLAPVSTLGVVTAVNKLAWGVFRAAWPRCCSRRKRPSRPPARGAGQTERVGRTGEGLSSFEGRAYRMVLPVRRRIHWGIGRFCFWALASFCLVRNDLWLCNGGKETTCQPVVPREHSRRPRRLLPPGVSPALGARLPPPVIAPPVACSKLVVFWLFFGRQRGARCGSFHAPGAAMGVGR